MPRHRQNALWWLNGANVRVSVIALVFAVLFSPAATRAEGTEAPNPDNVLTMPRNAGVPARANVSVAAASGARVTQRTQRARSARAASRQSVPVAPQAAPPAWPDAAATAGSAMLMPVSFKTVREMTKPEPDTALVFENELSDLDLAAPPVPTATVTIAATEGRAAREADIAEHEPVAAMADTLRAIAHSAWLEPVLLALAGALAALSAVRLFA